MKYIDVFIKDNISIIDTIYTYQADFYVVPGMRVIVPFGKGNATKIAIVLRVYDLYEGTYSVKNAIRRIDDEPILTEDLIQLGYFMKERYLTSFNQSFLPILPPGDIKSVNTEYKVISDNLTDSDMKAVFDINNQPNEVIKDLLNRKIIKKYYSINTEFGIKKQIYIRLSKNYLMQLAEKNIKLTKKQLSVIEFLVTNGEVKQSELLGKLQISNSPIKSLIEKKLVIAEEKEVEIQFRNTVDYLPPALNIEQINAIESVQGTKKLVTLLYGLTGSGKTEVYLKLAEETIKNKGQVIVLVPEIGLTPQMIERFVGRFKEKVAVIHSKLSRSERYEGWRRIKNSEVDIVIGARSAVFAPFENLKLIIIDEEHDNSYRFHDALRYDTFEVAKKRMELLNGKILLGSATPEISTYYKTKTGEYNLATLKKRAVKGSNIPNIEIVDMRNELIHGNTSIFSEKLKLKLEETMHNNNQAILFLNRRGYSHFVSCRTCGHVINCDNCDISMTYHKPINRLRCHYCGATKPVPKVCPVCGSKYIKQFGIGTQQVEEYCRQIFPDKIILRMDRDTTSKKDSYEEVYSNMKNNKADILIGTQMLAKGLDFENVTLVGVIAADLSLHVADYKAEETTFDLLTQVSGRAGRSEQSGDVIIQTYSPDNYAIKYAANNDYESFYEEEIKVRQAYLYPPFVEMVSVYFISDKNTKLDEYAYKVLQEIGREIVGYEVQYSRIITMPKVNNMYKVKFTLKVNANDIRKLSQTIKRVLNKNKKEMNNVYTDIEFMR